MPWPLRRAIAIQRQRNPWLTIQLYDITNTAGTVLGTYTGVGAHESNYESSWEENNKDVGVSYFLTNPTDNGTPLPAGTVALVHAHTTNNGNAIEGINIKQQTAPARPTSWVAPAHLSDATGAELRTQMAAHQLSPKRITNLRKVARETGVWPANFSPGTNDNAKKRSDRETIYYLDAAGFITSKNAAPSELYDVNGDRLANIYTSSGGAQAALDSGTTASPAWYVAPVAAAAAAAAASSSPASAPTAAMVKRARKRAAAKAAAAASPVASSSAAASLPAASLSAPASLSAAASPSLSHSAASGSATTAAAATTNSGGGYSVGTLVGAAAVAATAIVAIVGSAYALMRKKSLPVPWPPPSPLPQQPSGSQLRTTNTPLAGSTACSVQHVAQPSATPGALASQPGTAPPVYRPAISIQRGQQPIPAPATAPRPGTAPPIYCPALSIQRVAQPAAASGALASRPSTAPPVYRPAPPIQRVARSIPALASGPRPGAAPSVYRPTNPTLR